MSEWEYSKSSLFNMKFPEKLWNIVNECTTGAIGWGDGGETITLEYNRFQEEYLNKDNGVFKTCNIASFVRQLNLYGFRKCNRYHEAMHEFKHPLFVRDRKDLLGHVRRKTGSQMCFSSTFKSAKSSRLKCFTQDHKYNTVGVSSSDEQISKTDIKRTPLRQRNPNILNQMENFWWNHLPPSPYSSNAFYGRHISPHGWMPADATFYNAQNCTKQEPEEYAGDENSYAGNSGESYNRTSPTNVNGNMYFLVMPGYPPAHNIYPNTGFYNGILPLSGMPLSLPTDKKNGVFHSGRAYDEEFKNEHSP